MDVQGADQSVCAVEGHQDSGGAAAVGHWSSPSHYCLLHLPDHFQCKVLPMLSSQRCKVRTCMLNPSCSLGLMLCS